MKWLSKLKALGETGSTTGAALTKPPEGASVSSVSPPSVKFGVQPAQTAIGRTAAAGPAVCRRGAQDKPAGSGQQTQTPAGGAHARHVPPPKDAAWDSPDWKAYFDERAAIAEYVGEMTRPAAEARAYEACIVQWLELHPVNTDPTRCHACGMPERGGSTIVPYGATNWGHVWLHPQCWDQWMQEMRSAARANLAAVGIYPADLPGEGEAAGDLTPTTEETDRAKRKEPPT